MCCSNFTIEVEHKHNTRSTQGVVVRSISAIDLEESTQAAQREASGRQKKKKNRRYKGRHAGMGCIRK
jgi:hypothetical protein